MTLETLRIPERSLLKPRIMIFGVGGAGCNAVNNLIARNLDNIEFVAANTDAQSLAASSAESRIQLGVTTTQGLGAGADPLTGKAAAEESIDEIRDAIEGVHLCFIAAGMGGGTGTGAAPVVARVAREAGVLTVAVVIKPFEMELDIRMAVAEQGIAELENEVNTLIVIPNENLFDIDHENMTWSEVLAMANDGLFRAASTITDLIACTGEINRDFADVKSVFSSKGRAMFGFGEAEGEDRGARAAEDAMCNKLVEDVDLEQCERVLINVIGGSDMKLVDIQAATRTIQNRVGKDKNVIFGSDNNSEIEGRVRVSVIATGMPSSTVAQRRGHFSGIAEPGPGQDVREQRAVHSQLFGPEWRDEPIRDEPGFDERDRVIADQKAGFDETAVPHSVDRHGFGDKPDIAPHDEAGPVDFIAPQHRDVPKIEAIDDDPPIMIDPDRSMGTEDSSSTFSNVRQLFGNLRPGDRKSKTFRGEEPMLRRSDGKNQANGDARNYHSISSNF